MGKIRLDENCLHYFKVTDVYTGEITCRNCGVVISDKPMDYGTENSSQKH